MTALAAAAQDAYPYVGLSVGRSTAQIDERSIASGLLGTGVSTAAISSDERDTAYKLFAGYQFNRIFGVELGYFRLGKFGFDATTVPAGRINGRIAVQGANLDLVATLPLSENWAALGRVGAQYARSRDTFTGSGAMAALNRSSSERETNAKFGVGLQYAFSPGFLLRGEAERYRINDGVGGRSNVNMMSLSLVFPFGHSPRTVARVMPTSSYVQAAPAPVVIVQAPPVVQPPAVVRAPEVVAVAPPPPPPSRRVSFSAESLFGFDQSSVRPEGKTALDKFTSEIEGTRYDSVSVEGHTDRLGSTAYNQTLSLQRAEAVKAYLVGTGKIDGMKVTAVGKSESEPVTRPADCKGERVSAALIACLQADRRVEVELSGQR